MSEAREAGAYAADRPPDPGTQAVGREDPPSSAEARQGSGPLEVLLGGGGDPLVFGLPVFVSGSLVLGFALIGMVPVPSSLGSVLPATTVATGLGEFVTALWAMGLGQTMVAAIFGLFAAFWFSLFAMLMGLFHNWYNIPAAQAVPTQEMFFIAWLAVFIFLTLGILRLPAVYVLLLVFVDLAVLFVLLAIELTAPTLFVVAGVSVLGFCACGLYAFLNTAWAATGSPRAFPPLGPPVWQ
jgi:uncharacterized protein